MENRKKWSSSIWKAERRQYGLKHCITSTIHVSMGCTFTKVGTQISHYSNSFKLLDNIAFMGAHCSIIPNFSHVS